MEYQRAYWDERPDENLINRHRYQIFPLLKIRYLFSECRYFQLFDVVDNNNVQESVYAFTNGDDNRMTLVLYNNRYEHAQGKIYNSVGKLNKQTHSLESVSLAQSLRLTMGGRHFAVLKSFPDNLDHIIPSMRFYEDGFWVSLDGYQLQIFTQIREVEDTEGLYSRLYQKIGNSGVADLEREINLLYLEPFLNVVQKLSDPAFLKILKSLLSGTLSDKALAQAKHEILQTLGTYYTYTDEMSNMFSRFGFTARSVQPSEVLTLVDNLSKISKQNLFADGNLILANSFANTVASAFACLPFTEEQDSLSDLFDKQKHLMLETCFPAVEKGLLFTNIISKQPSKKTEFDFSSFLEDSAFLKLIGTNCYNGCVYYNAEAFQEALYVSCFALSVCNRQSTEKAEKFMKYWLTKNNKSEYKVDNLK